MICVVRNIVHTEEVTVTTSAPSLRSIKKDAARSALSDAARRIVLERGLDHVTVRDIAAAVGVSARTFNNYFSSKEEAVFASAFDRTARIADALRLRPRTEDVWQSLTEAFLMEFAADGHLDEGMLVQARLVAENPRLVGEQLKMYAALEQLLALQIARRLGRNGSDMLSRQAAAAAVAATRVAFDLWLDDSFDQPFRPMLQDALRQVGDGFAGAR
jgi:AcrR family transcriptional regulator